MDHYKSGRHILVLGAGSDIAKALLRILFSSWSNCHFYLLARNVNALDEIEQEGKAKGHTIEIFTYDLLHPPELHFSNIECCLVFSGWLPPDNSEPEKAMIINYTAIRSFLDRLIKDNSGVLKQLIITGSIAGERVRPANKTYGEAKAALHKYAKELQQEWAGKMYVTLVIPGYVNTKMIEGKETPAMLTLSPQKMAEKYVGYLALRPRISYSQPAWKLIATILKLLPEFVIKKLKF